MANLGFLKNIISSWKVIQKKQEAFETQSKKGIYRTKYINEAMVSWY